MPNSKTSTSSNKRVARQGAVNASLEHGTCCIVCDESICDARTTFRIISRTKVLSNLKILTCAG